MYSYQLVIAAIVIAGEILNAWGCLCLRKDLFEVYCSSEWGLYLKIIKAGSLKNNKDSNTTEISGAEGQDG